MIVQGTCLNNYPIAFIQKINWRLLQLITDLKKLV
ncbi:MAG: hypothetical protein RIR60_1337 [Pseudomonadota bacterium]